MPGLESPFKWEKNNVACIEFELKREGEPQ